MRCWICSRQRVHSAWFRSPPRSIMHILAHLSAPLFWAEGRWFPPGTPVSSTRKLISSSSFHRLDMTLAVAEALHPNKPNLFWADFSWSYDLLCLFLYLLCGNMWLASLCGLDLIYRTLEVRANNVIWINLIGERYHDASWPDFIISTFVSPLTLALANGPNLQHWMDIWKGNCQVEYKFAGRFALTLGKTKFHSQYPGTILLMFSRWLPLCMAGCAIFHAAYAIARKLLQVLFRGWRSWHGSSHTLYDLSFTLENSLTL